MGLKITVCSWGKFWTQMIQRPKNPTVISEKLGAKTWVSEQKQTTAMPPALSITERWANHLSHPLAWPQIRNEITASHILRGTGAPLKPCLNLSALSCQFLLIGEGQEPWWVSLLDTLLLYGVSQTFHGMAHRNKNIYQSGLKHQDCCSGNSLCGASATRASGGWKVSVSVPASPSCS